MVSKYDVEYEPTLFIGLGGTGIRVLRHMLALKNQLENADRGLADAIGNRLQLLAFDTDWKSNDDVDEIDMSALRADGRGRPVVEELPDLESVIPIETSGIFNTITQLREYFDARKSGDGGQACCETSEGAEPGGQGSGSGSGPSITDPTARASSDSKGADDNPPLSKTLEERLKSIIEVMANDSEIDLSTKWWSRCYGCENGKCRRKTVNIFDYMTPGMASADGARQTRFFGRIAALNQADTIKQAIDAAYRKVAGAAGGFRDPRIVIVASLAGGTGSGMFWDVAMLARKIAPKAIINGFFVMAEPFTAVAESTRIRANVYAALTEISVLKNFRMVKLDPYVVTYPIGETGLRLAHQKGDRSLFDFVFLLTRYRSVLDRKVSEGVLTESIDLVARNAAETALAQSRRDLRRELDVGLNNELGDRSAGLKTARGLYVYSTGSVSRFEIRVSQTLARSMTAHWLADFVRKTDVGTQSIVPRGRQDLVGFLRTGHMSAMSQPGALDTELVGNYVDRLVNEIRGEVQDTSERTRSDDRSQGGSATDGDVDPSREHTIMDLLNRASGLDGDVRETAREIGEDYRRNRPGRQDVNAIRILEPLTRVFASTTNPSLYADVKASMEWLDDSTPGARRGQSRRLRIRYGSIIQGEVARALEPLRSHLESLNVELYAKHRKRRVIGHKRAAGGSADDELAPIRPYPTLDQDTVDAVNALLEWIDETTTASANGGDRAPTVDVSVPESFYRCAHILGFRPANDDQARGSITAFTRNLYVRHIDKLGADTRNIISLAATAIANAEEPVKSLGIQSSIRQRMRERAESGQSIRDLLYSLIKLNSDNTERRSQLTRTINTRVSELDPTVRSEGRSALAEIERSLGQLPDRLTGLFENTIKQDIAPDRYEEDLIEMLHERMRFTAGQLRAPIEATLSTQADRRDFTRSLLRMIAEKIDERARRSRIGPDRDETPIIDSICYAVAQMIGASDGDTAGGEPEYGLANLLEDQTKADRLYLDFRSVTEGFLEFWITRPEFAIERMGGRRNVERQIKNTMSDAFEIGIVDPKVRRVSTVIIPPAITNADQSIQRKWRDAIQGTLSASVRQLTGRQPMIGSRPSNVPVVYTEDRYHLIDEIQNIDKYRSAYFDLEDMDRLLAHFDYRILDEVRQIIKKTPWKPDERCPAQCRDPNAQDQQEGPDDRGNGGKGGGGGNGVSGGNGGPDNAPPGGPAGVGGAAAEPPTAPAPEPEGQGPPDITAASTDTEAGPAPAPASRQGRRGARTNRRRTRPQDPGTGMGDDASE